MLSSSYEAIETTVVDVPKSMPTYVLPFIKSVFLIAGKNDDVVIIFMISYFANTFGDKPSKSAILKIVDLLSC